MAGNPIQSVEELKEHRKKILAKIKKSQKAPSQLDRLAIWITDHVGSMGFFLIIFCWTIVWLGWNMFAPKSLRFDPFPGFVLWLFISNLIQLFLLPMIMIGQNVQAGHADARAEADLQINEQAELEIETVLRHLEDQNKKIIQILENTKAKSRS